MDQEQGRSRGVLGRITGRKLNEGNRTLVAAAVGAARVRPGDVVADVGFGGRVGLCLLLDAVGDSGHVHGFDVSKTMVEMATKEYADLVAAGRLTVGLGLLDDLPLSDAALDAVITCNSSSSPSATPTRWPSCPSQPTGSTCAPWRNCIRRWRPPASR